MAASSVSSVNNMAQFMQLVSQARSRNSGLGSPAKAVAQTHNLQQPVRPQMPRSVSQSSTYSYARQTQQIESVGLSSGTMVAKRVLGTRFDSYA